MQTSTHANRSNIPLAAHADLQHREHLVAELGPSVRAGAVANRLGISVPMVDQLRMSSRILAMPQQHGYVYPSWQFEGRGVLSGLMSVLKALATYDPWQQLAFLVTSKPHLANQRPLDALRDGEVEAVLAAARRYAERTGDDRRRTSSGSRGKVARKR